ncbi:TraB/GumN family protein [Entomospira culicis]|uniref:TraB/GumN family protein n=1 Tax=Entomospira culicis TaxID=2719989 RepID=A0A968GFL5_9SPIO|nr:TraB/GumN family protein [Entomospira culicis]NIZ18903.1 TraB/GumN family protein [Entomospira culicis]NIZ69118.1 TraB/GumN family protein [Entomospira culicis]WDI37704.1 TraB/GumN family protein [Entomospira culicis]WDI39332.1 TraB/GumN family protein [Entomospira culicis]
MSDTPLLEILSLKNGDTIYLLGTAHVSARSVEDVREVAQTYQVDAICVEIDADRLANMRQEKAWKESDLISILKKKQGFLLLVNLALASFQKKIGDEQGVAPGSDMKEAVLIAESMGITPALVDRKVSITLRRVWAMSSFWQKTKLFSSLILGVKEDKADENDIESLKNNDILSQMMEELGKEFPSVKSVLIDERDIYLAHHIYHTKGNRRLAVVGAGHMRGIIEHIHAMENGQTFNIAELEHIPARSTFSKFLPYVIPIAMLALILFVASNQESKADIFSVFKIWTIANIAPVLLLGTIALAHPLALLAGALLSPITSFIPVLNAGLVAATIQAMVRKPRASDFESMTNDFPHVKKHYKNRVLHTLFVFILINIGSLSGAWIATVLIASMNKS